MKIGTITGLHIGHHNKKISEDYLGALVEIVKYKNLDVLLIAGDISNHYQLTHQFITQLTKQSDIPMKFVLRNHDLWEAESMTTQDIWNNYKNMSQYLVGRPFIANGEWVVIGHTGQYNRSFAAQRFSLDELRRGKYYGAIWRDRGRTSWGTSDQNLSKIATEQAKKDLLKVGNRKTILVIHVVMHPDFIVPISHCISDSYDVFIETSNFDPLHAMFDIPCSIMGHVHFRKSVVDDGRYYLYLCLGYPRQQRSEDIYQEIDEMIQIIKI